MKENPLYNTYNSYYKHYSCFNGNLGKIYNIKKGKINITEVRDEKIIGDNP